MKVIQKQFRSYSSNCHFGCFKSKDERLFSWVYDCGSEKFINDFPCEKIDIIFLSHFDEDHMNGCAAILQRQKNHHSTLVFPYMGSVAFLSFCRDIKGLSEPAIRLYQRIFQAQEDDNSKKDTKIVENCDIISLKDYEEVSTINEKTEEFLWEFRPYLIGQKNLKCDEIRSDIFKKLGVTSEEEIIQALSAETLKKDVLLAVYNGVLTNKGIKLSQSDFSNMISMCLYAGPTSVGKNRFSDENGKTSKVGWLHTGDATLKGKKFKKFKEYFQKYGDRIKIISLPHHGSKSNIDSAFIKYVKEEKFDCIVPFYYRVHIFDFVLSKLNFTSTYYDRVEYRCKCNNRDGEELLTEI